MVSYGVTNKYLTTRYLNGSAVYCALSLIIIGRVASAQASNGPLAKWTERTT